MDDLAAFAQALYELWHCRPKLQVRFHSERELCCFVGIVQLYFHLAQMHIMPCLFDYASPMHFQHSALSMHARIGHA